jgi:hypothetical protein
VAVGLTSRLDSAVKAAGLTRGLTRGLVWSGGRLGAAAGAFRGCPARHAHGPRTRPASQASAAAALWFQETLHCAPLCPALRCPREGGCTDTRALTACTRASAFQVLYRAVLGVASTSRSG